MDYLYRFNFGVKQIVREFYHLMKIIERLEEIEDPFTNAVVTIGNFDGVHIGHQSLFHEVILKAAELKGTSVAITFDPHPLRVLTKRRHPRLITLNEQKKELIAATKLDVLIIIPFTKDFAAISARDFISDLLVKRIGMQAIIVGKDYSFGKNREGDVRLLQTLGRELGFEVILADWIKASLKNEGRISSTRIRKLVAAGDVETAQKLLGRCYQIRGTVVRGATGAASCLAFPPPTSPCRTNCVLKPASMPSPWIGRANFTKGSPISATVRLLTTTSSRWKSTSWISMKIFTGKRSKSTS